MNQIIPEDYVTLTHKLDSFHLESINLILNEKSSYDVIIDIGCGDGSVTKMLSTQVPHKQLVAIDVDQGLLKYANTYNNSPTIEYVQQDMTVGWPELCPRLREMDGRVDLVFTSFMLHYCSRDKRQVMAIFRQLLKSDGLFYGNILINQDLNRKLLGKGKERDPKQQWYPSLDKQTDNWLKSLTDNGFMIEKSKLIELNVGMNRKQIIDFMPVVVDCYRCYFPDSQQFDAEVGDHLWDTVFDAFFSPPDAEPNPSAWTKFLADNTITELHYYFHCLRVIATKK